MYGVIESGISNQEAHVPHCLPEQQFLEIIKLNQNYMYH